LTIHASGGDEAGTVRGWLIEMRMGMTQQGHMGDYRRRRKRRKEGFGNRSASSGDQN